jgi:hypothetical protein
MTKLYELTGAYRTLADLADDPDMPAQALADSLEGLEGEIEIKAQALLQVVAEMEGDTSACDAEIKRLQHRRAVIQNRADSLRAYLLANMQSAGITKIGCPLFQITLVDGRPMVVIENDELIPEGYIKTTVTKAPIKADILKALKAGETVAGCVLGETKAFLRIT